MVRIASEDPEQARKDEALRALLDAYERAAVDVFMAEGIPDNWDDEAQADIDVEKRRARSNLYSLRARLFKMASVANVANSALVTTEILQAMCSVARKDEVNRAASWMRSMADRCLHHGGSAQWEEAQVLFRYASLILDMSPFPLQDEPGGDEQVTIIIN